MIKTRLQNTLAALTANSPCQKLLERLVMGELWLMGVGAASAPETSGERVLVDLLREKSGRVSRPLCIFDVGANRGQFVNLLVQGLDTLQFCIHAFEPGAAAFRTLADAYATDSRLTLNNVGLGAHEGSMALYSNGEASAIASLYRRRLGHFGIEFTQAETVTIDTLDAYCARHDVDRIDLLKLDVEGHELDVLRGAQEMFRLGKIDAVMFEFGGCNIDSRSFLQDFFYFFKEHGPFDLFRIVVPGFLAPIPEYREVYEQFRTTNFLAVRTDPGAGS